MQLDRGLNDRRNQPKRLRRSGPGQYAATLTEPLGQSWPREIISYPLPKALQGQAVQVTLEGQPVPSQVSGDALSLLVENLAPAETRGYQISVACARAGRREALALDAVEMRLDDYPARKIAQL